MLIQHVSVKLVTGYWRKVYIILTKAAALPQYKLIKKKFMSQQACQDELHPKDWYS